MTTENIWIHWL